MLDFEINLRSLLLLIAMLQGLVIAVLLLRRGFRKKLIQDYLLSGLLFFLALSLIEHFIGFMGVYDYMRESGHDLTFFPFSNSLVWGPLIWLYVQALTDHNFAWNRRRNLLFLPAVLNYLLHFTIWGLPEKIKFPFFESAWFFSINVLIDLSFYALTFWCLYQALRRYAEYRRLLDSEYSNTEKLTLDWLRNFIYGFCAYLSIDLLFNVTGLFVHMRYIDTYWLELIRAIHLYYISVTGWAFAQKSVVLYDSLEKREAEAHPSEFSETDSGSAKAPLSPEMLTLRRAQLIQHMEQQKPWLDAELTLSQLAVQLNLNSSQLSYLVNSGFDKNFNDFINNYRVEEVKKKMSDPTLAHLSLLGVAFECGFNSKATFNRAFKKLTGTAPTGYKGLKS